MKVAFATEDGQHVNAHFGWAKKVAIYEIDAENCRFDHCVEFNGSLEEDGNEDKLARSWKRSRTARFSMLRQSAVQQPPASWQRMSIQ